MADTQQDQQKTPQVDPAPPKTQQAPAPEVAKKDGPGVTALKALVAKGPPDVKAIVAIVDKNRTERDALFGYIQQTLGNAYAQQVTAALAKLRVSLDNKEVVAGDPSNPNSGYFAAGEPEQGAKWKTANGDHTGKIDKDGLDATDKLDAHDSIHTTVTKDKDAKVDWNEDGKTQAEAFAHVDNKDSWNAGVKKDFGVGKDGKDTLDAKYTHAQTKDGSSDMVGADLKTADGKTTASAETGVKNGKGTVDGSVSEKLAKDTVTGSLSADKDKQTITVADDHKLANGNDLIGKATVGHDKTGTTVGGSAEYKTKTDDVKAAVTVDPKQTTASISDDHKFKSGADLKAGVDVTKDATGEIIKGSADYKNADGSTTASGSAGVDHGKFVGDAKVMHKFGKNDVLTASIAEDKKGTTTGELGETHTLASGGTLASDAKFMHDNKDAWTGSLSEKYESKDKKTELDGSLTRTNDAWKLHAGGQGQLDPNLSLGGTADFTHPDKGKDQGAFSLTEQYKNPKLVQSLALGGGVGQKEYLSAKGSLDAQLGPKLYAGAFGGAQFENGKQTQANVGASLTFTPNEKSALTLAGIVDQHGTVETRLQYDMFKTKLDGVAGLADHKKETLLSLFLSYKTQAGPDMLDDRFGASSVGASHGMGGGQVTAGLKISF